MKRNIISIFNQKGGSGKTTSAVSIAGCLSKILTEQKRNEKVLLVDCDPGCGASMDIKIEKPEIFYSRIVIEYCKNQKIIDARAAISETEFPLLSLMPSDDTLGLAMTYLSNRQFARNSVFKRLFSDLDYSFILFDTMAGAESYLTFNALKMSNHVIVPLEVEKKNMQSFLESQEMISRIQEEENPDLSLLGAFLTKVDTRRKTDRYCLENGEDVIGPAYIPHPIHQMPGLAKEASYASTPLEYYNPKSRMAKDYRSLTEAILERLEGGLI